MLQIIFFMWTLVLGGISKADTVSTSLSRVYLSPAASFTNEARKLKSFVSTLVLNSEVLEESARKF